jgi:hypothetical protein
MRRVRFLRRAYVNDRLYEPGEEDHIGEEHFGAHMVDAETGEPLHHLSPGDATGPIFLDHTGDATMDTSKSGTFNPALAASPESDTQETG